jgi:hypothetical protein
MEMPKVALVSVQCPHCASHTKVVCRSMNHSHSRGDLYAFECDKCGSFDVLTEKDSEQAKFSDPCILWPELKLQDLWV